MSSYREWILPGVLLGLVLALVLAGLLWTFGTRGEREATPAATEGNRRAAQTGQPKPLPVRPKTTGGARPGRRHLEAKNQRPDMSETQLALLDFLLRMKSGEQVKLTREEVEEWLRLAGRTAGNLLAAAQLTNDPALLEEAARNFPNDPQVQLEVLLKDAFPQARQRWLAAFKLSAPDNALANYLAARELFKAGQPEAALQELRQAALKPGFDTYALDLRQSHESAWTTAGYPLAAAQMMSQLGSQVPAISAFNEVAAQTAGLADKYRQAGDVASADALAGSGLLLANRIKGGTPTIIQELVGTGIENKFLQQMSPEAILPGGSQTVSARQAQVKERQESVLTLMRSFDETAVTRLSDEDIAGYFDRVHSDGGYEALRWLRGRLDGQ